MSSEPTAAGSLFGCLRVLCDHHGIDMPTTLDDVDAVTAGLESIAAAERALVETGFAVERVSLTPDALLAPGRSFPLLAGRRRGGYVLIVGTAGEHDGTVGVFDPEGADARALPWTGDRVIRALEPELLQPSPTARPAAGRDAVAAGSIAEALDGNGAHAPGVPTGNAASLRRNRRRNNMADIYADAFENILVHNGLVRIDLGSYALDPETGGEQPSLELTGRLVMPIEGFAKAFGGMEQIIRQLIDAGVIEPVKDPGGTPPSGTA